MDFDTPLTANQLAARQRAAAPNGRAAVGPKTIREAIRSGEMGAQGGSRFIATPAELGMWLEHQRVKPPPESSEQRQAARARVNARCALA